MFYLTQALPIQILSKISTLPIVGSKSAQDKANNFMRLITKMKDMQGLFIHFTHNEFIYDG